MTHPLTVELVDQSRRLPRESLAWLGSNVERAAQVLNASGEVRIRVIEDGEMAQAHEEFAGVPGTTDVLTFDLTDPEESRPPRPDIRSICSYNDNTMYELDTDILVCIDEAHRQAAVRGYAIEKELLLYVVHGMLHCLGWDDHDEDECAAMHRVEDAVLTRIGVGPVYARE